MAWRRTGGGSLHEVSMALSASGAMPYHQPWASCQIRKIAGCTSAGNAGNVFTSTGFKGNRLLPIYNHDNIAIRSHIMIYNFNVKFNSCGTKSISIYLAKGEKRSVFRLSFVNLQRVKDGTHMIDAIYIYTYTYTYIYMCVCVCACCINLVKRTLGITPH